MLPSVASSDSIEHGGMVNVLDVIGTPSGLELIRR